jgi:hypothetical protein
MISISITWRGNGTTSNTIKVLAARTANSSQCGKTSSNTINKWHYMLLRNSMKKMQSIQMHFLYKSM